MQVIISAGGRFHAFYLAQQLLKRGYLKKLITSYPKFEIKKYGFPLDKTDSIVIKEILERGWKKLPCLLTNFYDPQFLISELFDRLACRKIEQSELFVGWSSFSLHSLRKAKKMGMITVLERGSSHILFQNEILKEEYERFGLKPELPHPKIIEKELQEYQETDYIFVPSSFAKRTFLEKGILESKLIRVAYGVDLKEFKQVLKKDNVFRVVYVGSMSLRKGVLYLLSAFSELGLPHSELLLIGGMQEEMKPFFQKHKGHYRWIGHQPQKDLQKYYSQGSVFVIPSLEEGMAMVQLQAMACGLPLVCTQNSGGEDLIEQGKEGFVVPIRNVEALKEKILYFYENKTECQRMGQLAQKKVSEQFSWDVYGEKIISLYQEILKKNEFKKDSKNPLYHPLL